MVWNQCWGKNVDKEAGVTYTKENGIYHVVKSTTANNGLMSTYKIEPNNHRYYVSFSGKSENEDVELCVSLGMSFSMTLTNTMQRKSAFIYAPSSGNARSYIYYYSPSGVECEFYCTDPIVIDLTQMFGAGNEPSTIEEFEAMFPNDYYEYCEPTIISSQTDRIDVASADGTITQQITTNFPALNSAGSVYDYIDLNGGKLYQRVASYTFTGDEKFTSQSNKDGYYWYSTLLPGAKNVGATHSNEFVSKDFEFSNGINASVGAYRRYDYLYFSAEPGQTASTFIKGKTIYYVLAEPIVTDIEIPTELTDWLEVETGGSITFHNSDEGKRLLIPNTETFVRKLDEVM